MTMNDDNDNPLTNGSAEKVLQRFNEDVRETLPLMSAHAPQHGSNLKQHLDAINNSLAKTAQIANTNRLFDQHQIASLTRQAKMISKSVAGTSIASEIHRTLNSPIHQAMAGLASQQLTFDLPVLDQLKASIRQYEQRFIGPDLSFINDQMAAMNAHPLADLAISHQVADIRSSELLKAIANASSHRHLIEDGIKQLRSNWIDIDNPEGSVRAFARITDLNATLRGYQSFVPEIADNLRTYLGDWRDPVTFPEEANVDLTMRVAIYEEHGVDVSLTDFPDPAYVEILETTGLSDPIAELEQEFGDEYDSQYQGETPNALDRTAAAHRRITVMEISLRRFIDFHMTLAFGPNWPKQQLPDGYYKDWVRKQEKAVDAGEAKHPLIDYADFTEYQYIICRKDNWAQVFKPFFLRPEFVRETFQRLHYTRLDTMHGRLIEAPAELLMYAETYRIFSAIRQKR